MLCSRTGNNGEFKAKKGGSLKTLFGGITATCTEFGEYAPNTHSDIISSDISKWKEEDGEQGSEAFEMDRDLPKLYTAVFNTTGKFACPKHRIQAWAQFLTAIVLMARASDVTTFCPIFEDILLPDVKEQWDADGLPKCGLPPHARTPTSELSGGTFHSTQVH